MQRYMRHYFIKCVLRVVTEQISRGQTS